MKLIDHSQQIHIWPKLWWKRQSTIRLVQVWFQDLLQKQVSGSTAKLPSASVAVFPKLTEENNKWITFFHRKSFLIFFAFFQINGKQIEKAQTETWKENQNHFWKRKLKKMQDQHCPFTISFPQMQTNSWWPKNDFATFLLYFLYLWQKTKA